jgi:uncharacterized integral membrane protein
MKWFIRILEAMIVLGLTTLVVFNHHSVVLNLSPSLAFEAPLMLWMLLTFILGIIFSTLIFSGKHILLHRKIKQLEKKIRETSINNPKVDRS